MSALLPATKRMVIVPFSGGVSSAWCANWALRIFPRDEVVLLFHDTKREHVDTYRFLNEMAAALGKPITEFSDGRSVIRLFRDEGYLGNGQNTFCSRMLKAELGELYVKLAQASGYSEILKVVGYSFQEPLRVQRMVGHCVRLGIRPVFPLIKERIGDKQICADWCVSKGVQPSAMYCWSEHANCVGCVKGGRAYWLKVLEHEPAVFWEMSALEEEFGHSIIRGEKRASEDQAGIFLKDLARIGLKRAVNPRESITLASCECGD